MCYLVFKMCMIIDGGKDNLNFWLKIWSHSVFIVLTRDTRHARSASPGRFLQHKTYSNGINSQ